MLVGILSGARRNNARDDITGALICRHDLYLQAIEGPAAAIDALYARILVDNRHCEVRLLVDEDVSTRMFPAWSMREDETPSLFWSPAEVAAGSLDKAGPKALRDAFARLPTPAA